jgi:hypothetical protein
MVVAEPIDPGPGPGPAPSDLGYRVTLTRARAALRDLQFTTGGAAHAGRWRRSFLALAPVRPAYAHPGHAAGGEITGELPGPLLADWTATPPGAPLGTATLVAGRYTGANFRFRRATAAELAAGDPLVGHTFELAGSVVRDGRTVAFIALVDLDEDARLVGAPFAADIGPAAGPTLGLRFLPTDPTAPANTLWNGIDFFALAGDAVELRIEPGQEAHNRLRRALQVHDHYDVRPR